jgi:hypothetical protein
MSAEGAEQTTEQHMIVTFDAFTGNTNEKDFIIKGLTIYNLTKNTIQYFEFAAPFDWDLLTAKSRQQNFYVTRRIHGLSWYSGDIPHHRLLTILKKKTDSISHVYAKGEEPSRFLREMLGRDVINIESGVMTQLPAEQLTNIMSSNQAITMRCTTDHNGFDDSVTTVTQHNACCFTRALRLAEFLKVYITNRKHQNFQQQQTTGYYKIYEPAYPGSSAKRQ